MTDALTCPQCHAELPSNAPAGMCPRCLMEAALAGSSDENQARDHSQYAETTPQPRSFLPPESGVLANHFPHLEILELLGQGGMGAVYKARQPKLDRLVALKIIRPESAYDHAFTERFNREARTLARLNDPNIVAIHDFGEVTVSEDESVENLKTLYYFLMEYVDGANLRQLMDREALSLDQTLQIVPQICDALQFAHDEGVVHRDVKPENILVDRRGRVKIADFGLAKLASPSEQDFTLTGTHQVMGTPRYMAPEQMAGSRAVDHRADLYSLGVVFYEMLSGEAPAGHFSPPSKLASIDPRLDDVVMKALAQKPDDRFQSASEIHASLEAIAQDEAGSVLSESVVSEPPPARGFSTIFEREIGAAWNWVVHPEKKSDGASNKNEAAAFPLLLFLTLSLLGGLTMLLPWAEIHVDQGVDVSGFVSTFPKDAELEDPVVEARSGTDNWSSTAAPITCLVLVLVIALAPSRRSPGIILSGMLTLLSLVALIHAVAFTQEVKHQPAITLPLSVSPHTAQMLKNPSADGVYDPVADAAAPREIHNQRMAPRLVEHRVIYQEGFYAALGISLTLVVLNVVSVRNAILNREPKPKAKESWSGTPLASLRFAVPTQGDFGAKVKFHFLGQGYELAEERPGVWIFQRGRTMSAIFDSDDIRLYPTRLTVNSIDTDRGELLVNCHWSVRLMGGWARKKDIKILEDEGRELQTLLGGQIDEPAEASVSTVSFGNQVDSADEADVLPRDGSRFVDDRAAIDLDAVEDEVSGPAIAMMVVGFLMMVGHGITGLAMASGFDPTIDELAFMAIPGIFVGLAMLVGGFFLHGLRSQNWVQVGIIAGFLPVSPAVVFTMFVSVLAMKTLSKPQVKLAFRQRKNRRGDELTRRSIDSSQDDHIDIVAIEDEVSGPAIAMIAVGLLTLLGLASADLMILSNRSDPLLVWLSIPGLLVGLGMLAGGFNLKGLRSRGWTQLGVIAGFIPVSPAWLLSLPVCLWANFVLRRPHVKRAFLERARQRQREWRSGESNLRRKPVIRSLLLILLTAGILIGLGMALNSLQPTMKGPTGPPARKPPVPPGDRAPVAPPGSELHDAAGRGDVEKIKQSLDEGADVNVTNGQRQTPLMKAAITGDARTVAYLMLRGADEQARDLEGKTALMHAVELGHSDAVQMLLDLEQAHTDEEIQFRLSRVGPDVADEIDFSKLRFDAGRNLVDGQGESPLMKAAAGRPLREPNNSA